jgi:hypothetical protein
MNKLSNEILINFYDAVLEDKVELDTLLHKETIEKYKNSFLFNQRSFNDNYKKLDLNKELESIVDEKSKKMVENIAQGKI